MMAWHAHAKDALERLGPARFARFYCFGIVRNPWERLLSWHTMLASKPLDRHRSPEGSWAAYRNSVRRIPFSEFLEKTAVLPYGGCQFSFAFNQVDYLCDAQGKLLAEVFRFEDYRASCRTIGERLGIDLSAMTHRSLSSHPPYRKCYTAETREIVAQRFRRDIEMFGYDF
jgi:hypothetical protein